MWEFDDRGKGEGNCTGCPMFASACMVRKSWAQPHDRLQLTQWCTCDRQLSLPRPAERIDLTNARPAHHGRLPVWSQAHEGIKYPWIVHSLQSA